MRSSNVGPDIVIAGAARSGTSHLAAILRAHPAIDPGAVREPNYFSREYDQGPQWYDGLYKPRRDGLLRLDGSMSYTFPHFPDALRRLAETAPRALVIYAVRDPLARTLAHYQLHRDDIGIEAAETFGEGLASNPVYLGTSEYDHWISLLYEHFPAEQVLLVPFDVVRREDHAVAARVCETVELPPPPDEVDRETDAHPDRVAQARCRAFGWARRLVGRGRELPSRRGRKIAPESLSEALASCGKAQLNQLSAMQRASGVATLAALRTQDARLGLDWATVWARTCSTGDDPPALAFVRNGRE